MRGKKNATEMAAVATAPAVAIYSAAVSEPISDGMYDFNSLYSSFLSSFHRKRRFFFAALPGVVQFLDFRKNSFFSLTRISSRRSP